MPNKKSSSRKSTSKTRKISKKKTIEALMHWKVKEFEKNPKNFKFYFILYLVLFALTTYGLITNNLLLSILIILAGFSFIIFEKKEPADMNFAITEKGILVHDDFYTYKSLKGFWIEYEPEGIKEIYFKTTSFFNPILKIPIYELDPSKIRKYLIKFIPEKEITLEIMDIIERL